MDNIIESYKIIYIDPPIIITNQLIRFWMRISDAYLIGTETIKYKSILLSTDVEFVLIQALYFNFKFNKLLYKWKIKTCILGI